MSKIINFPPQPSKFEEVPTDWFYEGTSCRAKAGTPNDSERSCSAFEKKYPEDNVTAEKCYCVMCNNFLFDGSPGKDSRK